MSRTVKYFQVLEVVFVKDSTCWSKFIFDKRTVHTVLKSAGRLNVLTDSSLIYSAVMDCNLIHKYYFLKRQICL